MCWSVVVIVKQKRAYEMRISDWSSDVCSSELEGKADYGVLDDLASNRINTKLIVEHWDDLLRLAGSLKLGVVRATGLTRVLQTNDRPTKLARALQDRKRVR